MATDRVVVMAMASDGIEVVLLWDQGLEVFPDEDRVRKSTGQLGHILDALDGPTVLAQDLKVPVVAGGNGQLRANWDHL